MSNIPPPGSGSGGTSPAGGQWWAVWTLASAMAGEITPHVVRAARKPVQGSQDQWGEVFTVAGPFGSQAAAEHAAGLGPPPGSTGPQDKPPGLLAPLLAPLAGIDEVGAVLTAAFTAITDINMWRSVGYLLLGVALLFVGIRLWLGKPPLPRTPTVIPVPV